MTHPVREIWDHPRFGWAVKGLVLYTLLIEVGLQLLFGKVTVPFIPVLSSVFGIDIGIIEMGRGSQAIPPEVIANGMVLGALYSLVAMGKMRWARSGKPRRSASSRMPSANACQLTAPALAK